MDSLDKTFLKELFHGDYYRGYKEFEIYVLKTILNILHAGNISDYLQRNSRTVDEITGHFGFHAQSKPFLKWALDYLVYMDHVHCNNSSYQMSASDDPLDRKDHIQQIVQYQPTADIFVNLIQAIEERIGDFLEGRISGGDLLFSNESMVNLWNSYFNNQFYGYSLINHGVAYGIAKWFSHTKGTSMLEVGSGTSGASTMVFQMLRDNNLLDSMNTILLTDVVPSLLDQGRRNIEQRISDPPHFVQEVLDINKSLGGQGLEEKSFDIIFGVNVLHVARDLAFSLEELYQRLHKGGVLIIAETIRPATNMPMHQEFIFNLLENYHDVELDGETRPCHGFLTRDQWVKNFEKAGFRNIEYLKEPDGHEEIDFDIKPLHAFMVLKGQK